MALLEIKNLSKSFGNLKAVDDVSFTVPEGSVFGLIGRNGAGKTTTIRMMMNIYLPDNGEVLLEGAKIGQDFRNKVGYLPEERGLYKKMKVLDTLLYFAALKGSEGKQIEKDAITYLKMFNLEDRKGSKVEDLSKGNQQKVQFITTVLHNPQFLILDEPFSGLDPINTDLLTNLIMKFKEEGKIIILSTHLMDFAERLCNHIAMIEKGKLILNGSLNEIKANWAAKNITLEYSGDISFLNNIDMVDNLTLNNNNAIIKMKQPNLEQELLKLLVQNDINVHKFIANDISLHEIFVSLAGENSTSEGSN
ncbi:MAG: ATP-binding cassette domain-containing protein [Bacteroidota bacterium]|nr:ATP-binding cassette domain-containing protein [Bacteroidota bacterium]